MTTSPSWGDHQLEFLLGQHLPSSMDSRVSYELNQVLGSGTTAVAFVASRISPMGTAQVVVKVLLPHLLQRPGEVLRMAFKKEVVALGRLGEQVPPTPFVVRLLEAGELPVEQLQMSLPWLSLEFVHGGSEGTTLYERVCRSIETTGRAFPAPRVARAIECIAEGLAAIHSVGVIHRDLNPGNVLCCGSGHEEVFKIADFGISRPVGLDVTFGQMELGTPGYSSPEQLFPSPTPTTVTSDVFSMGAIVFMMLAGEELFPGNSNLQVMLQSREHHRRSIAEAPALDPEIASRRGVCEEIDRVLRRATAPEPEQRFECGSELAAALLGLLRTPRRALTRSSVSPATLRSHQTGNLSLSGWSWQRLYRFGEDRVLARLGWQAGGHCLALTAQGFEFWDGTRWYQAPTAGVDFGKVRCLRSVAPGTWLLMGDEGLLAYYSHRGPPEYLPVVARATRFLDADGDPADLAVFVGQSGPSQVSLHALCGGRWLKPLACDPRGVISGLSRLGDERWLLAGRNADGTGAVWLYDPLDWRLWPVSVPSTRAYLASAASSVQAVGTVVGTSGASVRLDASSATACGGVKDADLSAVAMAPDGTAWAASLGRLWLLPPASQEWQSAWEDRHLSTPIVGLYAESSRLVAVGVDGGVLEGRRILPDQSSLSDMPTSLRRRR